MCSRWCLAMLGLLGWVGCLQGPATVTPVAGSPATGFDRARVVKLIQQADLGHNADVLEYSYFDSRRTPAFPKRSALALVDGAMYEAAPSSRRWFVLGRVWGFAAYRVGPHTRSQGSWIYRKLFTQGDSAERCGAADVVDEAAADCAGTLCSGYASGEGRDLFENRELLAEALAAHLTLLRGGLSSPVDACWERAARATGAEDELRDQVSKALADPTFRTSYDLLSTAADLFTGADPERAANLMAEAMKLKPPSSGARRLASYQRLADLMRRAGRWDDAAKAQSTVVKLSGRELPLLAFFYLRSGDMALFRSTFAHLCGPGASGDEVIQMAAILTGESDGAAQADPDAAKDAIRVLEAYLSGTGSRNVATGVDARLMLAGLYLDSGRKADAANVVHRFALPEDAPAWVADRWRRGSAAIVARSAGAG